MKPAFCGPCFGAGDTPAHNAFSIRHATRNFPNREGSKPGNGQIAAVALMDARSIAATARNGGILTAATDIEYEIPETEYKYDRSIYDKRVYNGFGKAAPGSSSMTLYLYGVANSSSTGELFRSTDNGASWIQINDPAHQWGGGVNCVTGDMRTFGTVYVGTNGRGIIWGTSTD